MNVGGRTVCVDTNRYEVGPNEEAVVLGHQGEILIEKAELDRDASFRGKRSGFGPWRKQPKVPFGPSASRAGVWIVGTVVNG